MRCGLGRYVVREEMKLGKRSSQVFFLFHSKKNVGARHELQTSKEAICACVKDSQFKSAQ